MTVHKTLGNSFIIVFCKATIREIVANGNRLPLYELLLLQAVKGAPIAALIKNVANFKNLLDFFRLFIK